MSVAQENAAQGLAIELGLPGTFAARGVFVPFTTPALDGARARLSGQGAVRAPGDRIELLLPNPSGKGGVYVIAWETIPRLCCPTLFDRDLIRRISALAVVTPGSVRGVVHWAGATGLAGEAVCEAASHAAAAEQQERLVAHVALLMALIRQGEGRYGIEATVGTGSALEGLERRARRALAGFATDLALPEGSSEALGKAIESLAALFGAVGLGPRAREARLARLHAAVEGLAQEAGEAGAAGCEEARLVGMAAGLAGQMAGEALRAAQARADDMPGLLREWSQDPERVAGDLARAAWVLDGWDRLALQGHQPRSERAWRALAAWLPAFPEEARLPECRALAADMRRMQRWAAPAEDWRLGLALADLVAANESALARQLDVESVRSKAGTCGIAA